MIGGRLRIAARVAAVGFLTSVPASGDEPCAPLGRSALERVCRDFALDADQTRWLLDAWAAGRLTEPVDLEGWPGTGPELRDDLAAALCWSTAPSGHVTAGTVVRKGFAERRGTVYWESRSVTARGRVRGQSTGVPPSIRGGVSGRRGVWSVAGGTLEGRRSLGLVLETAGTTSRGTAPRVHSSRRFEVTLGSDPWTPAGGALGLARGAWSLDVAGLRIAEDRVGSAGAGVLEHRGRWLRTTLCAVTAESGAGAVSLAFAGAGRPGDWAVELARGGQGSATGTAASVAAGPCRIRGSLEWRGRGYASPLARGWETAQAEAEVRFVAEVRWSDGDGRSLRVSRGEAHAPDSWGFPERSVRTEVEAGERLARGLEAAVLWRGRSLEVLEGAAIPETDQEVRGELRWVRAGHQARIRLDERLDQVKSRALHVFLARSRGPWRWEVRAVRSHPGAGASAPRVYFRRAGDGVGWTTARPGTSLGVWVAGSWSGWTVEASADGGAGVWTGTLSLHRGFGGAP